MLGLGQGALAGKRALTLCTAPSVQVERALRVVDGTVAVFDSVAGVEPKLEVVWRQADKFGVPRICFVNNMDHIGANFIMVLDQVSRASLLAALAINAAISVQAGS